MEKVRLGDIATVRQGLITSGRGAGARPGPWRVRIVNGRDLSDGKIRLGHLDHVQIEQNAKTEKHLLHPYDVLITSKSTSVKAALVPPTLTPAVANATMLVVHPLEPERGLFLWWYATSRQGQKALEDRMVGSSTISSLPPTAVADVEIPNPPQRDLYLLAQLIEESERAYTAGHDAVRLRRESLRDYVIGAMLRQHG